MDPKLRQLLDDLPEKPPRSKLEPHAEVIRLLRKKRRTYQEIAHFLREHLQVSVAPSTIHDFVKTRARQAKRSREAEETPLSTSAEPKEEKAAPAKPAATDPIAALKQRPKPAARKPVFEYDENEPLRLVPHSKKRSEEK
jgi:IS30 family transposase